MTTVLELADQLVTAEKSKQAISPIAEQIKAIAGNDDALKIAYEIQQLNLQRRLDAGARIVGKKIGLTSLAVQQQLGVDQPDYGSIFAESAYGTHEVVDGSQWIQPKAEAEIAFVLSKDLDKEHHTFADLISSIDYALAAIEIVDSRIADWKISLLDTVADNASYAAFVLGGRPVPLRKLDLSRCGMYMERQGLEVSVGAGVNCLGNPLNAAVWLANRMVAMGTPLKAGDILLSGALGPMVNLGRQESLTAHIEGLGSVTLIIE
ncbi:2-keto-4-pentenoate hydratase [Oligella urethralis]|uniref:2-keto-4-pentenoate hydratase n=1 Tax=Oligella urethralis TaxID=90245 RepID=UPI0003656EF6|nr:fumarylacetoacetate hydrolase family protein [Oligella urethralis]SUA68505.1 2-oxopent-4-enoate hydratase [Oligella urethralis]